MPVIFKLVKLFLRRNARQVFGDHLIQETFRKDEDYDYPSTKHKDPTQRRTLRRKYKDPTQRWTLRRRYKASTLRWTRTKDWEICTLDWNLRKRLRHRGSTLRSTSKRIREAIALREVWFENCFEFQIILADKVTAVEKIIDKYTLPSKEYEFQFIIPYGLRVAILPRVAERPSSRPLDSWQGMRMEIDQMSL